jgi:hypothetical protein
VPFLAIAGLMLLSLVLVRRSHRTARPVRAAPESAPAPQAAPTGHAAPPSPAREHGAADRPGDGGSRVLVPRG